MPKAARNVNVSDGVAHANNNTLKRNQACHQVRLSKSLRHFRVESDETGPVSEEEAENAPILVCTFDEPPSNETQTIEDAKNQLERMQGRISELEEMLRQRNGLLDDSRQHSSQGSPQISEESRHVLLDPLLANDRSSWHSSSPSNTMFFPNWPHNLPEPELLNHLVELFFTFHPHANQLFHAPTFMASLVLPPEHPKFPATPILHAICALASLYTRVVSSAPPLDYSRVPTNEMFTQKYGSNDTFADRQAQLSRETAQEQENLGVNLLQIIQAHVILSWFYCTHARFVISLFLGSRFTIAPDRSGELFSVSAHALRLSVPLSLNICPPFTTITTTARAGLLPAARNVVEDETRRNTFWLAYTIERCHGAANGWANSIDDADIFQLLPVRNDQFIRAELIPPSKRQWSHTRDLLLTHPEDQVDPFILYVKSAILVKTFNMRFKARHFTGEESVTSDVRANPDDPIDPRKTLTFIELDRILSAYLSSFPVHLRNPVQSGIVDCNLVAATLISHLATIVLHEPHADFLRTGCLSARKAIGAARAMIEIIYQLWSTSFDLSLLESYTSVCFYQGGRLLGRSLHAALKENHLDHISALQSQIAVIRTACEQMGRRHCLALRFTKMLDDDLAEMNTFNVSASVS
ncbi:hypothetical protein VNI00_001501 [Paramarasmius palmivorus]|uniref:Xylanolytic transcriptional activator regulatory domain-containing protein n=1 Tax=Paramarasmius palmivorus TaxID=297713 RepID=A0AAW0E2F5_9AGAR